MKLSELTTNTAALNIIKQLIRCFNYDNKADTMAIVKQHCPDTVHWIASCYNVPRLHEIVLHAVNELLEAHGIESIEKRSSHGCGRFQDYISYVNMGDPYIPTLFFDMERKRKFFVSDVASVVEKQGK